MGITDIFWIVLIAVFVVAVSLWVLDKTGEELAIGQVTAEEMIEYCNLTGEQYKTRLITTRGFFGGSTYYIDICIGENGERKIDHRKLIKEPYLIDLAKGVND